MLILLCDLIKMDVISTVNYLKKLKKKTFLLLKYILLLVITNEIQNVNIYIFNIHTRKTKLKITLLEKVHFIKVNELKLTQIELF